MYKYARSMMQADRTVCLFLQPGSEVHYRFGHVVWLTCLFLISPRAWLARVRYERTLE